MHFGEGLFEERQPPAAVARRLGEGRGMRIRRELIVDVDVLRSSFDVRPHCEDALLRVPRLMEELWNELPAVCEGSCHG